MLKLGNFLFDIDDYPEELQLGGTSLVSIEKYPGGKKAIQNMGAFDDAIPLTGIFRYQGALTKARVIDAMWRAGDPVQLFVDSLSPRWVIITAAKLKYRNEFDISYEITLERLSSDDPNEILYGNPAAASNNAVVSTQSASPQKTHTVMNGDTLWSISKKYYGDGSKYTKIASNNNIKNPNSLTAGQQLVIPA